MHLSALHRYPLKSATGLVVETLDILASGPRQDRRWLVVDADGRFVTARQVSQLVLVRAEVLENGLGLSEIGRAHV